MKNIKLFLIGSLFLISIAFAIYLTISFQKQISYAPLQKENCKTLIFNSDQAINLVFLSNKEKAEKYSNFLFSVAPFDKYSNYFNVYYIENYKPKCEIYNGIALLCYSKEILSQAAACPNDYIIVPKEDKESLRSSSYMNVLSLNLNHPLTVFTHEIGHSLASLSDEYAPSNMPKGAKNCVSTCEKFGETKDGCFQGCAKEELYRSIEKGIMRTLFANRYGLFNEKIIEEQINKQKKKSLITGKVIQDDRDCSSEKYYLFEGYYANGEINITGRSLKIGCAGSNGFGDYDYRSLTRSGKILTAGTFNPVTFYTDGKIEEGDGGVFEREGEFYFKVPAIPGTEKVEILSKPDNYEEEKSVIATSDVEEIGGYPCKLL